MHAHAAGGKRGQLPDQLLRNGVGLVVARPGLEQVAEQEQVARRARLCVEPVEEQRRGGGVVIAQVHVGAKQRNVVRRLPDDDHLPPPPTTAIESMTTASTGTSWWGPTDPVRTLRIAFTTSMPLTTLPNTA